MVLAALALRCGGLVSGGPQPVLDAGSQATIDGGSTGSDAGMSSGSDAGVNDPFDAGPSPGRMVWVVTGQDMRHMVSFDGLTWEHDEYIAASGLDNAFTGVAIGNHAIVISGDPGIYRSTDGISYALVLPKTSMYGFHSSQALYANGYFMVVAGAWSFRSVDGLTWESKKGTDGASGHWHGLIFANNQWLALGDQVRKLSDNGLDWHDVTAFEKDTFQDVAYGNGQYLAVGRVDTTVDGGPATGAGWVATSSDAKTWTRKPDLATVYNTGLATVAFGNGVFFTRRAGDVMRSPDGESWSLFCKPASPAGLTFENGQLASAGWRTEAALYSPDAGRFISGYTGTHPNRYDDAGIEPWFTGFAMGEL